MAESFNENNFNAQEYSQEAIKNIDTPQKLIAEIQKIDAQISETSKGTNTKKIMIEKTLTTLDQQASSLKAYFKTPAEQNLIRTSEKAIQDLKNDLSRGGEFNINFLAQKQTQPEYGGADANYVQQAKRDLGKMFN